MENLLEIVTIEVLPVVDLPTRRFRVQCLKRSGFKQRRDGAEKPGEIATDLVPLHHRFSERYADGCATEINAVVHEGHTVLLNVRAVDQIMTTQLCDKFQRVGRESPTSTNWQQELRAEVRVVEGEKFYVKVELQPEMLGVFILLKLIPDYEGVIA